MPVPESLFNNFFKKETPAKGLSCKFRKLFKNTFFIEHLWWLLLMHLQQEKWKAFQKERSNSRQ